MKPEVSTTPELPCYCTIPAPHLKLTYYRHIKSIISSQENYTNKCGRVDRLGHRFDLRVSPELYQERRGIPLHTNATQQQGQGLLLRSPQNIISKLILLEIQASGGARLG